MGLAFYIDIRTRVFCFPRLCIGDYTYRYCMETQDSNQKEAATLRAIGNGYLVRHFRNAPTYLQLLTILAAPGCVPPSRPPNYEQ